MTATDSRDCPECDEPFSGRSSMCPHCKQLVGKDYEPEKNKSIALAFILSLLAPGLGHIYIGQGYFIVLAWVALFVCGLLTLVFIGFILFPLMWLIIAFHAAAEAITINRLYYEHNPDERPDGYDELTGI